MEDTQYQPQSLDEALPLISIAPRAAAGGWRDELPTLRGSLVTLRELRVTDAAALFAAVAGDQVSRFISPPPVSLHGFEQFIAWSRQQRAAGQCLSFAVVPNGADIPIGIFQIRSCEPSFGTSEWGFALTEEFWGSGVFLDGAKLVVEFAFGVLGARRLEARAATKNGRGTAALRKLGAVQEGLLRRSLIRNGEYLDQSLWTITAEDWVDAKTPCGPILVH